jgi:hypothetical protein
VNLLRELLTLREDSSESSNTWEFSEQDMGFSGADTLYGPVINGHAYYICEAEEGLDMADLYDGDEDMKAALKAKTSATAKGGTWECGVLDVEDNHQPQIDLTVWVHKRADVIKWLDKNKVPHPTEEEFQQIGL